MGSGVKFGPLSNTNSHPNSDPRHSPKKGPKKKVGYIYPPFSDFSDASDFRREPQINFGSAPKVGLRIELDGRPYRLVGVNPHVRRDGAKTTLLTWEGRCADCSEPFLVTTGLTAKAINRRCDEHKAAGKPATDEARQRLTEFRRKIARGKRPNRRGDVLTGATGEVG